MLKISGFCLPKQRFHALWQPDIGLKLAFSGVKYASDASGICASSYEIRSKSRKHPKKGTSVIFTSLSAQTPTGAP
jgi:hypothetical protein